MRVIPVIDLKEGAVVRGVAGRRQQYRPIESRLAATPDPADVAAALKQKLLLEEVYVADLDAISGEQPNWRALEQIAASIDLLWVDAGVGSAKLARRIAEKLIDGRAIDRVVVGLESLAAPADLQDVLAAIGPQRAVFSLDLKQGEPLVRGDAWQGMSPERIAELAAEVGFRRFIVLDLARVGVGQGTGVEPLCRRLRRRLAPAELVAGGGVRHLRDLQQLADAGCDAVLVASALHDGRLSRDDLESLAR